MEANEIKAEPSPVFSFKSIAPELIMHILEYVIDEARTMPEIMHRLRPILLTETSFVSLLDQDSFLFKKLITKLSFACSHIRPCSNDECPNDAEQPVFVAACINTPFAVRWLRDYLQSHPITKNRIESYPTRIYEINPDNSDAALQVHCLKFLARHLNIPVDMPLDDYPEYLCEHDCSEDDEESKYIADRVKILEADLGIVRERQSPRQTPLMLACEKGNIPFVKALIELNANVNARDRESYTPLMYACRYRPFQDPEFPDDENESTTTKEIIALLLQAKADVNARTEKGKTALMEVSYIDAAALLLQAGANVNAQTNKGHTALMKHKSVEWAEFLINHGADCLLTTEDNKTAAELIGHKQLYMSGSYYGDNPINAEIVTWLTELANYLGEQELLQLQKKLSLTYPPRII